MKSFEQAKKLAESIIKIFNFLGKKESAIITDMNQPLGRTIGNIIEVKECYDILSQKYEESNNNDLLKDIMQITMKLGEKMLFLGGITDNKEEAQRLIIDSINSGKALQYFEKNIKEKKGDITTLHKHKYNYCEEIRSETDGYIQEIDAFNFVIATMLLDGGRKKIEDSIDYHCGIEFFKKYNSFVNKNDIIATIYYNNKENINHIKNLCSSSIKIAKNKQADINYILYE